VAPTVTPASDSARDREIAEAVEARIAGHDAFPDLVEDLLDGLGKGFAVVEIDWETTARLWSPRHFHWVDPRFIKWDRDTLSVPHLITDAAPTEGEPLAPFKFLVHRPRLKSGIALRGGLARVAAFSWMCKAFALKDWVAFAETYGLPLRLGRYGPEATREDVEQLFRAVANIGTDAAAVLPRSMEIEFQNGATGAGGDKLFESLARYLDEQVSKAVLGQTMTADSGSSLAQAAIHNEVRHDIAAADARAVTVTLNRDLVRPFVDLNFGVQPAYPRLAIEVAEPEDLTARLTAAERLIGRGLRVRAADLRRALKLGEPDAGEETVGAAPPPPAARPQVGLNTLMSPAAPDEIDALTQEMLADWRPVMSETLDPIRAAIEGASSYDEALAALAALPGLPAARVIDALVKGMFRARALGDVRDD
jgi:phage gp29-like protein